MNHYEAWCQEGGIDPESVDSENAYDRYVSWCEDHGLDAESDEAGVAYDDYLSGFPTDGDSDDDDTDPLRRCTGGWL